LKDDCITVLAGDVASLVEVDVTCQGGDVTFEFVAGNLALDFVGTVAERTTQRVERLGSGADLARWLILAGLVDTLPAATPEHLAAAKVLREALYRSTSALTANQPPPPDDLTTIAAFAAPPPPTLSVDPAGRLRRTGDLTAALSAVARSGLELYGEPERRLIRWCDDATCTRPFLDRSRGQRRRWCGMTGCGDRAKAAAYRARMRARGNDPQHEPDDEVGTSRPRASRSAKA
jgi:predicted RNA-binding Zn ribbon-like protein